MKTFSNHISPVRYPYFYSESVVNKFIDKHSRVTVFIAKKLHKDPRDFRYTLIKLFMDRNGAWNSTRDTIKYIEKHDLYAMIDSLSYENVKKYLTGVKYLVQDSLIDSGNMLKRD